MIHPLDASILSSVGVKRTTIREGALSARISATGRSAQAHRKIRQALRRHMEGLRLVRPLPHLEVFHASSAPWRIVDGSNRSSKTMSACIEFCRCVLGCDPYGKYPLHNGNAIVVGMLLDHIEMIWRKCAQPGSFKMIRDEQTGLMRAVRPDPNDPLHLDPYDEAHRERWKDAAPLIPPRMINGQPAWEDKGRGIPAFVELRTGWRVHFRSSKSVPPQGDHYNFALLDEELLNPLHLVEIQRGLVAIDEIPEHRPKAVWSATGQTTNPELMRMREEADRGSTRVAAFKALIKDNPYIPDEEKQAFHDALSPDERKVRFFGEHGLGGMRCYQGFDAQTIHGCEPFDVPADWCRYLILDPGTRHCGTLLAAVDPMEHHVWIYDGFDLRNGDPATWAMRIAERDQVIQAGIIDTRAGRQRSMGMSAQTVNVARAYREALREEGVNFTQEGPLYGFFPGSDDQAGRQAALQSWLSVRRHGPFAGTPVLQVVRGILPELEDQIRFAHMDMRDPKRRAKPAWNRFHEDLLVCLEYLAAHRPRYFSPPEKQSQPDNSVFELFKKTRRVRARRRGAAGSRASATIEIG